MEICPSTLRFWIKSVLTCFHSIAIFSEEMDFSISNLIFLFRPLFNIYTKQQGRKPFLFTWIFDERYALPSYLSLRSLIFNAKDIPAFQVLLIVENSISEDILNCFNAFECPISIKYYSDFNITHGNPEVANRLLKIEAVNEFSDDFFVFLVDADIMFSSLFSEEFNLLFKDSLIGPVFCGTVEYDKAWNTHLYFAKRNSPKLTDAQVKLSIFSKIYGENLLNFLNNPQYNTGFAGFYKLKTVAQSWRKYFKKGFEDCLINLEDDQIPLSASLYLHESGIMELPNSFNSKGVLSGSFAVFHAWNSKWIKELKVNLTRDIYLSDFGKECLFHLKQTPDVLITNFKRHYNINDSNPVKYQKIKGDFAFENEYLKAVYAASNNKKLKQFNALEIEGTSNGKSLAFLVELCINYLRNFKIYTHSALSEKEEIVKTNLLSLNMLEQVEVCSSLEKLKDESFDFIFFEEREIDRNFQLLKSLIPQLRKGGFLGGYLISDPQNALEVIQKYCFDNSLDLSFTGNCFFISKGMSMLS